MSSRNTLDALQDLVDSLSTAHSVDDIGRALLRTGNRFGYVDELIIDLGKLLGRLGASLIFTLHPPPEVAEYDERNPFEHHPFTLQARASPQSFRMSHVRKAIGLEGDERWWQILPDSLKGMDGLVIPVYDKGVLTWCAAFAGPEPDFSAAAQATMEVAVQAGYALYLELLDHKMPRSRLSRRESNCLRLLARGKCDADIGETLGISPRTVRFHLDNVKKKLGVSTRIQAVAKTLGSMYP